MMKSGSQNKIISVIKNWFQFLMVLVFLGSVNEAKAQQPLPSPEEYSALIDFYNATNGANWTNNSGWKDADPNVVQSVAGWYGIAIDANGHISSFSLYNNNLIGAIPPSIQALQFVGAIDIGGNSFTSLTPQIGKLSTLQFLSVSSSGMSGNIPASIGKLQSLTALDLNNNQLSGVLPDSLFALTNLVTLNLSSNNLTGSISPLISGLINLRQLALASNNLSGLLPGEVGDLINLEELIISNNQFTGGLPSSLGDLESLITLNANQCALLGGSLPSSFGNLVNLKTLNLLGCNISGSIPSQIGQMTGLETLWLNQNQLSGAMPPELGNLITLKDLQLSSNALSGEVPPQFSNLVMLEGLGLDDNQLSGILPANLSNLNSINIEKNQFTFSGFLPLKNSFDGFFIDYSSQDSVDVAKLVAPSGNSFTLTTSIDRSTMPGSLYQWFKYVDGVNDSPLNVLSSNGHTVPLTNITPTDNAKYYYKITNPDAPALTLVSRMQTLNVTGSGECQSTLADEYYALWAFYTSTKGAEWTNRAGWSTADPNVVQSVEGWYGVDIDENGHVIELSLYANNLVGTIPPAIGNLKNLKRIYLTDNNALTGNIPEELYTLGCLEILDLSRNNLSGIISSAISGLSNLKELMLLNNNFSGALPDELGSLSKLETLLIANSSFTGGLPSSLGNLSNLRDLTIINCPLGGQIPQSLGTLHNLENLFLANCNLTGNIPVEIGEMESLVYLMLYNNQLNSTIPLSIGYLSSLRILDFSSNSLSGIIPLSIGNLSNLQSLSLAFNQLNGTIPLEITNLNSLQYIALTANNLSGSIPQEISNLTNLQQLGLTFNQLSGSIPNTIGALVNLQRLDFGYNQFTGLIPIEIGSLTNLRVLVLRDNQLSGSIPSSLGNLINLEQLVLINNKLEGYIPAEVENLINIQIFFVSDNHLSGPVPVINVIDPSTYNLAIENNRFTFSHFLSTKQNYHGPNFSYFPQDSVDVTKIVVPSGNSLTLTTSIDRSTTPQSTYQWFKYIDGINDVALNTASDNNHTITFNVTTADNSTKYYYKITNPDAPALTLVSRMQTLNVNSSGCQSTLEEEYHALWAFYNSTNGAEWFTRSGWSSANPNVVQSVVGWYGVQTDIKGHVTSLSFFHNNLSGSIPPEIGNLKGLTRIQFLGNSLIGNIPDEMYSLGCLQILDLSSNVLTGPLSPLVSGLHSLKELVLAGNSLSGTLPDQLGDLSNLTYLNLGNNQFTGGLPASLGNLSNLEDLAIFNCPLTGEIPASFGALHKLRGLVLAECGFSGSIPEEIGQLTNLTNHLMLNNNQLTGPIPPSIGNLSSLKMLRLSSNRLSGSIPPEIGNLSSVESLLLEDNQLTGAIPAEIGNLSSLGELQLNDNQLTGAIPTEIGNLAAVGSLSLSNNNLNGSLPVSIFGLINLRSLSASGNQLTGAIPDEIGLCTSLGQLDLGDNQLSGSIPLSISNLTSIYRLWLNDNNLSGPVPVINLTEPWEYFLLIENNRFTFSDFLTVKQGFGGNYFGYFPQDSVDIAKSITASSNSITLTTSIDRNTAPVSTYQWFKYIDGINDVALNTASINNHTITINVTAIDNGTKYYYKISNPDAPDLTLVSRMQTLNFGSVLPSPTEYQALLNLYNAMNGAEWTNNTGWADADPNTVQSVVGWFGVITDSNGHVIGLDLSNNNLSGTIPSSLGNLQNLTALDLSMNGLTGTIPAELGNMPDLQQLNLSDNQLSGIIPGSLLQLESLVFNNNTFTFSDFLGIKNNFLGSVFIYSLQDSIDVKKEIPIDGTQVELTTTIDRNTNPLSLYQWFKFIDGVNDSPLTVEPSVGGHTIIIQDLTLADVGSKYYYKITNPEAPFLTLISRLQTIILLCEATQVTIDFNSDPYLCAVNFIPKVRYPDACHTLSYLWNFSDGTTSIEKSPVHAFPNQASFDVSLTVNFACGLCLRDTTITETVNFGIDENPFKDTVIQVTSFIKSKVINTSAGTFSDSWPLQHDTGLSSKNSFLNGSQGVWRNDASFVYNVLRERNADSKIATDGTFKLESFNWLQANLEAIPHWIKANTMTVYSPFSYELENRDVLGNYSAALYDYGGHLPAATGVNMRNNEMAFSSFEFLEETVTGNWVFGDKVLPGQSQYAIRIGKKFMAVVEASTSQLSSGSSIDIEGSIYIGLGKQMNYINDVNIVCLQPYEFNPDWTVVVFDRELFPAQWTGQLIIKNPLHNFSYPEIDTLAHSGKSSLKINAEKTFQQPLIKLDSAKSYFVNAWVSVNNPYVTTPTLGNALGYEIIVKNRGGQLVSTFVFQPSGKIIEGWQQVKGTFTCPVNNAKIEIRFKPGSGGIAWYDDLRLQPEKGNMKAYVYDLKDYRLRAILDEENFAAFFYYDVEGNLYLTKKETEDGIKTLTENISFQVENTTGN